MSGCSSAALGVLWLIAVVHIVLSIVLGALIAGVCYYGKQKQRREYHEDSLAREKSKALQEVEGPDKLDLSSPPKINQSPEPLPDEPNLPEPVAKVDLGALTQTAEIEIGSRKNSSEQPPTNGDEGTPVRKRSRISVISNISNRFRKSMDFDSARDDALRLLRERSSSSSERVSSEDRDIAGEVVLSSSAPPPSNYDMDMTIANPTFVEISISNEESNC